MRAYLALLVTLSGCGLYFGGDDEPPVCHLSPGLAFRNPETNQCEGGGGGGGGCGPCGPCTDLGVARPDWGYCQSSCTDLDERTCLDTSGCVASYDLRVGIPEEPGSSAGFTGCWETAPSGPIRGGGCYNLDAQGCSRHDDCAMFYTTSGGSSKFAQCAPEPTTRACDELDCGSGYHCEETCYPCDGVDGPCNHPYCTPMCVPDNGCNAILCGPGQTCITQCDSMDPTLGGDFPGQCYPVCVPSNGDPGSCTGAVACDALPPACPVNTTAGIKNGCWTGYCIPNADCGPNDPGTCEPAICATPGPACPAGTVGGTRNGCWTGYCIPDHRCGMVTCETLSNEHACTQRADCYPVYSGDNCTCDVHGCTCENLTFARCESH